MFSVYFDLSLLFTTLTKINVFTTVSLKLKKDIIQYLHQMA